MPDELADAIRYHETPAHAEECTPLIAISALAARLTDAEDQGLSITRELLARKEKALSALGVDGQTVIDAYLALAPPA